MTSTSGKKQITILGFFSAVMTLVLVIALISLLYSTLALFLLPTPTEYEGTFPFDPPLFSQEFWENITHGILRHLALLHEHVTARAIIGIVGLAFATNLIYTVRGKILEMQDSERKGKKGTIKLREYIKWGFGSIISAIISSAASPTFRIEGASIILILSVSALILTLNYPEFGLLDAIRKWISRRHRTSRG